MPLDIEKWKKEQIDKGQVPDKDGLYHYTVERTVSRNDKHNTNMCE